MCFHASYEYGVGKVGNNHRKDVSITNLSSDASFSQPDEIRVRPNAPRKWIKLHVVRKLNKKSRYSHGVISTSDKKGSKGTTKVTPLFFYFGNGERQRELTEKVVQFPSKLRFIMLEELLLLLVTWKIYCQILKIKAYNTWTFPSWWYFWFPPKNWYYSISEYMKRKFKSWGQKG